MKTTAVQEILSVASRNRRAKGDTKTKAGQKRSLAPKEKPTDCQNEDHLGLEAEGCECDLQRTSNHDHRRQGEGV